MSDPAPPNPTDPVTPEARARARSPRGFPVTLADGRTWLLADGRTDRLLDALRDTLFDDSVLTGQVAAADVLQAAWTLLLRNYDLSGAEIAGLLTGVDLDALTAAVLDSLTGPEAERRTFSKWVRASLLANGLRPDDIPAEDLDSVLQILIATGRTIPLGRYSDAAEFADFRRGLLRGD